MSVTNYRGEKIELPRTSAEIFSLIEQAWLESMSGPVLYQQAMKCLAILRLRECDGWRLQSIGNAFSHPKGHISRLITATKRSLRNFVKSRPDLGEMLRRNEENTRASSKRYEVIPWSRPKARANEEGNKNSPGD